jgi:hypothetical protein
MKRKPVSKRPSTSANRHRELDNAKPNNGAGAGRPAVESLTLRNDAGMTVTVMDWGATLLSARVTLADGSVREALLGCANPATIPTGRLSRRLRRPLR